MDSQRLLPSAGGIQETGPPAASEAPEAGAGAFPDPDPGAGRARRARRASTAEIDEMDRCDPDAAAVAAAWRPDGRYRRASHGAPQRRRASVAELHLWEREGIQTGGCKQMLWEIMSSRVVTDTDYYKGALGRTSLAGVPAGITGRVFPWTGALPWAQAGRALA